jgi:hypothetical protein
MTLLDEYLPRHHVATRHTRLVAAAPERVWEAVHGVTLGEMPAVRVLFALRFLPTGGREPILAQMQRAGFAQLAEEPGREVVYGVIAQMWKPGGKVAKIRDGADFAAFDRPGYAKGAMNFRLVGTQLETETRVLATDPSALRAFRRYWLFVHPGSSLIRRLWLSAIAARAGTAATPSNASCSPPRPRRRRGRRTSAA